MASDSWFHAIRRRAGIRRALGSKIRLSLAQRFGQPGQLVRVAISRDFDVYLRVKTTDLWVFGQLVIHRELEGFLDAAPATILDAGANVGLATVLFAHAFPNATIVAVEPNADNAAVLRQNVKPLGHRVIVVEGAVWQRSTQLAISNPDANAQSFRVVEHESGPIQGFSIQDLSRRIGPEATFDVLKIDIEGSERELLAANTDWIDAAQVVGFEFHDRIVPGCSSAAEACFPVSRWEHHRSGEYDIFRRRPTATRE